MEFPLWNVFSFLNSLGESCLCFLSTSLNANPTLTGLCVLWLFLLFPCYLVGIPSSPTVWETENRPKHHDRIKRRRKGGTRKVPWASVMILCAFVECYVQTPSVRCVITQLPRSIVYYSRKPWKMPHPLCPLGLLQIL
ncbi:hypothetical protein mRhiFer1_008279 [Rhinolophus ferrumequinum]|uniref:Uncharacterized protein n=1 Tax=Rhinolophus ferrumequinum TaxID=59479 RepID=A0A7J7VQY3_RHIFE|nr:hypothetical protein mRhiFer1_008279 [Rhinolophus ferrumequinum]